MVKKRMDLETRQTLINIMYKVIKDESLPMPLRILIRQPTRGGHRSGGKCISLHDKFKLIITVRKPVFVLHTNGRFRDKNGNKYKCLGWHDVNKERAIEIAAHEIAHLKFWNHDTQHKSYTNYLIEVLTKQLEGWNNE